MPIQLNYTDPNSDLNVGSSYWFIQNFSFDTIAGKATFTINGYLNLASKNNGKQPFMQKTFSATAAQLGVNASNTISQILNAAYIFALTFIEKTFPISTAPFFQNGIII